jgi:hypothetical protein
VYCLESPDLPAGLDVQDVRIDASVAPARTPEGVTVALVAQWFDDETWPYDGAADGIARTGVPGRSFSAALTPYHHRANRGPATMRVWMPCE